MLNSNDHRAGNSVCWCVGACFIADQTAGSVQGLRYSLVRNWLASAMVGDPLGDRVPLELLAGPERDVAQVADARQPMAVAEVARALRAGLDGVEPLAVMADRAGQASWAARRSCGLLLGDDR